MTKSDIEVGLSLNLSVWVDDDVGSSWPDTRGRLVTLRLTALRNQSGTTDHSEPALLKRERSTSRHTADSIARGNQ